MSGVQPLLDGLGSRLGHALSLDASHQCALEFSDSRLLVIAELDEATVSLRVELLSLTAVADPAVQQSLLKRAMALNYGQARPGLWLGWCEASNTIALLGVFNREGDPEDFVDAVDILLSESLAARASLLAGAPVPTAAPRPDAQGAASPAGAPAASTALPAPLMQFRG